MEIEDIHELFGEPQVPEINTGTRLYFALEGLHHALGSSAADPIVIASHIDVDLGMLLPPKHTFSHMFYYAVDGGEDIIRQRIQYAPDDIKRHLEYHENMYRLTLDIEESANRKDATRLHDDVFNLISHVKEYTSFVEEHRKEHKLSSFLNHLTCCEGHYSYRSHAIVDLHFNQSQTKVGVEDDLEEIEEMLSDFKVIPGFPEEPKINTNEHDSGDGFFEASYRVHLELSKQRLQELGLKI